MRSRSIPLAVCLVAAFLLTSPSLCAEGEGNVETSAAANTKTTTSIKTSGGGQASVGGGGTASVSVGGSVNQKVTIESSGETSIESSEETATPPPEDNVEEKPDEEKPAEEETAEEKPIEETPPVAADETANEESIASETVSDDGQQKTSAKVSADEDGEVVSEAEAETVGEPGESVVSVARATSGDDGGEAFAGSQKGDDEQIDAVGLEKPDEETAPEEASVDPPEEAAEEAPAAADIEETVPEEAEPEEVSEAESDEVKPDEEEDFSDLRECEGLSKFLCCDDKDFLDENGKTFCGCWGSDVSQGCSFLVEQKENPLVIKDMRGLNSGHQCKCPAPDAVENQCFGRTKIECCDDVEPDATKCKCIFNDLCVYEKVSDGVWKDTLFNTGDCVCPK